MLSPDFQPVSGEILCLSNPLLSEKKLMEFSSVSMPHRGASTTANSGLHQK